MIVEDLYNRVTGGNETMDKYNINTHMISIALVEGVVRDVDAHTFTFETAEHFYWSIHSQSEVKLCSFDSNHFIKLDVSFSLNQLYEFY